MQGNVLPAGLDLGGVMTCCAVLCNDDIQDFGGDVQGDLLPAGLGLGSVMTFYAVLCCAVMTLKNTGCDVQGNVLPAGLDLGSISALAAALGVQSVAMPGQTLLLRFIYSPLIAGTSHPSILTFLGLKLPSPTIPTAAEGHAPPNAFPDLVILKLPSASAVTGFQFLRCNCAWKSLQICRACLACDCSFLGPTTPVWLKPITISLGVQWLQPRCLTI